jgi:hypothetical protein
MFDHELSCTKEEASQYWRVPQQLKVTNDSEFEAYTWENYYLDDEKPIEDIDDGYFSTGLLPPNEKDEVSDGYFFDHLNDDSSAQDDWFEDQVVEERKSPKGYHLHLKWN